LQPITTVLGFDTPGRARQFADPPLVRIERTARLQAADAGAAAFPWPTRIP